MTFKIGPTVWMALLLAVLMPSTGRAQGGDPLFDALRRNDAVTARALLATGTDPNQADASGATPLMFAALYAGPECLQTLLDHGARVNAANKYGATALMWAATWNEATVRVLLTRGANVNAAASDGVTPLVAAARYGRIDTMRALLAAGADTHAPETRTNLLTAAYFAPAHNVIELLAQHGVVAAAKADFKNPVLNRNRGDVSTLQTLLNAGVDPAEEVPLITLSLPSFFVAAREGQLEAMKAFVGAGMNPAFKGPRGWTALMLAGSSEHASNVVMQYLLDAGVDINATDDDGRTALDWALTRGHSAAAAFLEAKGGKTAMTVSPAPSHRETPRTAAAAITSAVGRLQPAGPAFSDRTKCNSCHNQNIPGIAIAAAQRSRLAVNEALMGHSMIATNQQWDHRREGTLLGDTTAGGFAPNAMYALLEMAEGHLAATKNSDAMVLGLGSRQNTDGSWTVVADIRPPLQGTTITATALAIRGLREYAPAGRREEMEARARRATAFLRTTRPVDTQDQAFKLLGLVWGGAEVEAINDARMALTALQRRDGGWGQLPTLDSDAYATGQTLYALHAASMPASAESYQRGANYLLQTQLEDGTWFVRTRAFGFQPYFETGFPHGRSQFISTAGTAWAVVALTYALEDSSGTGQH